MSAAPITYRRNRATAADIAHHLVRCDAEFMPPLSGRVIIESYAEKLASRAVRFEAWTDSELIGLVAAYCNDAESGVSHITSVSVLKERTGEGIATRLLRECIEYAKLQNFGRIRLEVAAGHGSAIRVYEKCGFSAAGRSGAFLEMERDARLQS